jgi:hypothetical protein
MQSCRTAASAFTNIDRNIWITGDFNHMSSKSESSPIMSTRLQIAALVFLMTVAVTFGAGLVIVLMIPALAAHAFATIPTVVAVAILVSAPTAWFIAPTLRARYQRSHSR